MSSNRTKRLSLMAGGSLAAAWLLAAPTAALAANECGDPAGPDADSFNCSGTLASVTYVADGDLTLSLDDNLAVTTGGISVTGDDSMTITAGASVDGTDFSIVSTTGAAIDVANTGPGNTQVFAMDFDPSDGRASISGATHGIRATSTGVGGYLFTYVDGVDVTGAIGIEASTAGTSILFATVQSGSVTGSDTAISLTTDYAEMSVGATGAVTGGTGAAIRVRGGGGTANLTNDGLIVGRLDFDTAGATTFTNNSQWRTSGANVLGAGAVTLNSTGILAAGPGVSSIDFGTGGAMTTGGRVAVGAGAEGAASLTLTDLDTWTNSGRVLFGVNDDLSGSDGMANDRIAAQGAAFEGAVNIAGRPLGALYMDVNFAAQPDCSAAVGADCLDLDGGSTSGLTAIVLRRGGTSPGGTAPVVLVDLGSGTGAQGDFILSEFSDGYRRGQEGAPDTVEAGLFRYALRYQDGQHALVGIPDAEIAEFGLVADAALVAWDTATTQAFQRQADFRDALGDDAPQRAPGVWLRAANNKVDYTLLQHYGAFGSSFTYNTSYAQKTQSLVGGVDLLNTLGAGSGFVVGLTAGKTQSELDFQTTTSKVELDGHSLGAYASLYGRGYFLDAIVNTSKLDLEYSSGGLADVGELESFGVQLEGGLRFEMAEGWAFWEPLATFSHVTSEASDLDLSGVIVKFDESTTTRGALGVRVGGRLAFDTMTATITGTGRVWQEFEGEDGVSMLSNGPVVAYATDTGDTLGDVGAGVGVFSNSLRFSAGANVAHRFKQNYSSTDLSVYLRYWF